jgi:hypothetical protein
MPYRCLALWKEGTMGVYPVFNWVRESLGTWDSSSFYNILTTNRPLGLGLGPSTTSNQFNSVRFNQLRTLSSSSKPFLPELEIDWCEATY